MDHEIQTPIFALFENEGVNHSVHHLSGLVPQGLVRQPMEKNPVFWQREHTTIMHEMSDFRSLITE